ncbi:MAG: hypothetical protein AAF479_00365 [Pseudomonadota bacterium]
MHDRLWRQRRRLLLTLLLCALAGFILSGGQMLAGILLALQVGVLGLVISAIALIGLPEARWFVFKLAVLAPLCALMAQAFPGWFAVLFGLAAAALLPSQPWGLDRIRLPYIVRARCQVPVSLDSRTLWTKLYPHETNEHWDPFLRGIRSGRSEDTFFFVYEAMSKAGELQIPIKVFDVEPGVHFKTRDLSQPDASEGGPVIVTSHVIESNGDGAQLTLMEATWQPMLWTAFSQWLDDYLGDHTDRMAALLEGRRDWSLKGASLKSLTERAGTGQFRLLQKSQDA